MASKKKKSANTRKKGGSSGGRAVVSFMMLGALGVAGFAAYVHFVPAAHHIPEELRQPSVTIDSTPAPSRNHVRHPSRDEVSGRYEGDDLLIPKIVDGKVVLEPSVERPPDGVKPIVWMANQTLQSLKVEDGKAIGVDVKERNALIDFTPDVEQGFGSTEEGNLLKALQTAMGQFPEVDTFQLVVDGKPLTTLGQVDITDPIPVIRTKSRAEVKKVVPSSRTSVAQDPRSED